MKNILTEFFLVRCRTCCLCRI